MFCCFYFYHSQSIFLSIFPRGKHYSRYSILFCKGKHYPRYSIWIFFILLLHRHLWVLNMWQYLGAINIYGIILFTIILWFFYCPQCYVLEFIQVIFAGLAHCLLYRFYLLTIAWNITQPWKGMKCLCAMTWMNCENIVLSEGSQMQKAVYCQVPFIWNAQNRQILGDRTN